MALSNVQHYMYVINNAANRDSEEEFVTRLSLQPAGWNCFLGGFFRGYVVLPVALSAKLSDLLAY